MSTFKLALSADFRRPDGSPAFPSFDLSPLNDDARIDWSYISVADGCIRADDLEGYDALILLGASIEASSFPKDGRLSMVARFGVGYDNVDVAACEANDVAVVITPSGVRRPVAVAILTFVLALAGRLTIKDRLTRRGPEGWDERGAHMGQGLIDLTLGSVGIGNIGAEMFRLAQPLGMKFLAHDPYADAELAKSLGVELVALEDVFRRSDFVCINCPLTEETRGLVNAERLALMKPTGFLINTARGPIVDQNALTEALTQNRIAGAGLDVFAEEPSRADDPLFALENVIVTPHALCWTDQCFAEIGAADIRAVSDIISGTVPQGIVNRSIENNAAWLAKIKSYQTR